MIERLKELWACIENCERCGKGKEKWQFPQYEGVKGFLGTGKVMFVAERPSTPGGDVPRGRCLIFYNLLKEHGFQNAHLTDLVKCSDLVVKGIKSELPNCLPYLLDEIDIIKPKLIVAVGWKAYDELQGLNLHVHVVKVTHYCYTRGREKETFEEGLKRIRKLADEQTNRQTTLF